MTRDYSSCVHEQKLGGCETQLLDLNVPPTMVICSPIGQNLANEFDGNCISYILYCECICVASKMY